MLHSDPQPPQASQALLVRCLADGGNLIARLLEAGPLAGQHVDAVIGRAVEDHLQGGVVFGQVLGNRYVVSPHGGLHRKQGLQFDPCQPLEGLGDSALLHIHLFTGEGFVAPGGGHQRLQVGCLAGSEGCRPEGVGAGKGDAGLRVQVVAVTPALIGDLNGAGAQQRGQHQPQHVPFPAVTDAPKMALQRAAGDLVAIGVFAAQVIGHLLDDGRLQIDHVFGPLFGHQGQAIGWVVEHLGQPIEISGFEDLFRLGPSERPGPQLQLGVQVGHGGVQQGFQDLARRRAQGGAVLGNSSEQSATVGQGYLQLAFQPLSQALGLGLLRLQAAGFLLGDLALSPHLIVLAHHAPRPVQLGHHLVNVGGQAHHPENLVTVRRSPAVATSLIAGGLEHLRPIGQLQGQRHLGVARGEIPVLPAGAHPEVAQLPIVVAGQAGGGEDVPQPVFQDLVPLPGVGIVGVPLGQPALFLGGLQFPAGFCLADELCLTEQVYGSLHFRQGRVGA